MRALRGLLVLLAVTAAGAGEPLFEDAGPTSTGVTVAQGEVLRARPVLPRPESLATLQRTETLVLNLFRDTTVSATRRHVVSHGPGRFTWFGELVDHTPSEVALAVRDGRLVGRVSWEGQHYRVLPSSVAQIDLDLLAPEGAPVEVESAVAGFEASSIVDSGEQIDVLIAYTASSATAMGSPGAFVQLLVDQTNQSYENSGIVQRINLVFHGQVGYVESGSSVTDLLRLQNPVDGFLDEVHTWRDTYCADAVSLLAQNFDSCGLGFQMTFNSPGFATSAFSVARPGCSVSIYSYGHELGHNMGCNHDRLSTANSGAFSYSHGYVNVPEGWRTIMAIFSGTQRLQYWSNPDALFEGQPMGVAAGEADSADCRRTLNNTRSTVAGFRDSTQCVLRVPDGTLRLGRAGTGVTVSWDAACGVADDYTIYEGELDGLSATAAYSHASRICTDTAADLSETFTPPAASAYYLVVPRDTTGLEGSYGRSRPVGVDSAACGITGQRPGGVCP